MDLKVAGHRGTPCTRELPPGHESFTRISTKSSQPGMKVAAALRPLDCSGDTLPESQQVAAEAWGAHMVLEFEGSGAMAGREKWAEMFVLLNRDQHGRGFPSASCSG